MVLRPMPACRSIYQYIDGYGFRPICLRFPWNSHSTPSASTLQCRYRSKLALADAISYQDHHLEGTDDFSPLTTPLRRETINYKTRLSKAHVPHLHRDHVWVILPLLNGAFYRRRILPHRLVKDHEKLANAVAELCSFASVNLQDLRNWNSQQPNKEQSKQSLQNAMATQLNPLARSSTPDSVEELNLSAQVDGETPDEFQPADTSKDEYYEEWIPYSYGSLKWSVDRRGDALNRRLAFQTGEECSELGRNIMAAANLLNHHPHITVLPPHPRVGNAWTMLITCTTHQPRGLGMNDVKLARKINEIILQSQLNVTYPGETLWKATDPKYPLWKKGLGVHNKRLAQYNRRKILDSLPGVNGPMFGRGSTSIKAVPGR